MTFTKPVVSKAQLKCPKPQHANTHTVAQKKMSPFCYRVDYAWVKKHAIILLSISSPNIRRF